MTYYQNLLLNQNRRLINAKRALLWLGIFHYVTGLVGFVIAAIITWRWVFLPATWFVWGLVPANIAYFLVVDYKYVYQEGNLKIFRHRLYGDYKLVVSIPANKIEWRKTGDKVRSCTNREPTVRFVYEDTLFLLSCDEYMTTLLRGESYVFGQCRDDQDFARC